MSNYFYRFRSVQRLLGREGEPGELEKLEIYFASPSELNDPLEGYKDIFWSGDIVVWRNLIRHYSTCLIQQVFIHFLSSEDGDACGEILIHNVAEDLPPKIQELLAEVNEELLSLDEVSNYLKNLSELKRQVRRMELVFHLRSLHSVILALVFEKMQAAGICSEEYASQFYTRKDTYIQYCSKIVEAMKDLEGGDSLGALFDTIASTMAQSKIISEKKKWPKNWFYLVSEFPERFCSALELLTHPAWYTACFMSECSNSSIWGTYGGNHKGVCLKYKANNDSAGNITLPMELPSSWGTGGIGRSVVPLSFHKIDYEKSFIEIDFFKSLGNLPKAVIDRYWYCDKDEVRSSCSEGVSTDEWRARYWSSFIEIVTVKLSDWRFENEYRLLFYPLMDVSNSENRKATYKFENLEGMIFGMNTPLQDKLDIIRVVERLCNKHRRKDFSFYQARYDSVSKSIVHDKLNHIKLDVEDFS